MWKNTWYINPFTVWFYDMENFSIIKNYYSIFNVKYEKYANYNEVEK